MSEQSILADLLSRDATRIWKASHDVIRATDRTILAAIAHQANQIRAATDDIDLGGMLRSNRDALDFAMMKASFAANSDDCLCRLYPKYELFDPRREATAKHVLIEWSADNRYHCTCHGCGSRFVVEEFEYHYLWWTWTLLE